MWYLKCKGKRKEFSFLLWKCQRWHLTPALRRWHSKFSPFSIQLCLPCWLADTISGKICSCQTKLGQKHSDAIKSLSFSCFLVFLILHRCFKGNLHVTLSGDNSGALNLWCRHMLQTCYLGYLLKYYGLSTTKMSSNNTVKSTLIILDLQ